MEKQIKIEYQSGYLLCERRNPINGEYWVYISPKEWETKEDIIPTKANNPCGWFDKLHDQENYYTIVGTFVNGYAFEQEQSQAANAAVQGYIEALEKIANSNTKLAEDKNVLKAQLAWIRMIAKEATAALSKAEDKGEQTYGEFMRSNPPIPAKNSLDELERWVNENEIEVQTELNTFNVIEVSELLTKIQELKTITPNNGWISVEDRLPELQEDASLNYPLCIDKSGRRFVGFYSPDENTWYDYYNDSICKSIVTHWQQLPPKP